MRPVTLAELPPPPAGKSGWPWTESTSASGEAVGRECRLPSISLVTPSLNQGSLIEATIRSVLLQGYPRLEYLVLDGGSSDETHEVLARYRPWLDVCEIRSDNGQTDAINRGFGLASGEVVNWLCSDDLLLPGALAHVGKAFAVQRAPDVVVGQSHYHFLGETEPFFVMRPTEERLSMLPTINPIPQPSCYFRRSLLLRQPPLDVSFNFAMDLELWAYFQQQGVRWSVLEVPLSRYNFTGDNKSTTGGDRIVREIDRVYRRYVSERVPLTFWHRWLRHPLHCLRQDCRFPTWVRCLDGLDWACIRALGAVYGRRRVAAMNWSWTRGIRACRT